MSLTVFLAFCIFGCDFLLYVLFQWIYGEKRRKHPRRLAARREKRRTLSGKEAGDARVPSFPQRPVHYRTGFFGSRAARIGLRHWGIPGSAEDLALLLRAYGRWGGERALVGRSRRTSPPRS